MSGNNKPKATRETAKREWIDIMKEMFNQHGVSVQSQEAEEALQDIAESILDTVAEAVFQASGKRPT